MKLESTKNTILITAIMVFAVAFGIFSIFSTVADNISSAYLHLKAPVTIAHVEGIDEDATLFVLLQDAERVELWVKFDGRKESPTHGHLFLRRDRKSMPKERSNWQNRNFKLIEQRRVEIAVIRLLENLIQTDVMPSSTVKGVTGDMLDQTIWRTEIAELLTMVKNQWAEKPGQI